MIFHIYDQIPEITIDRDTMIRDFTYSDEQMIN